MSKVKFCYPECRFFKCGKNAAVFRKDSVWCKWTEETCDIAICQYSLCVKRRLLPKGICGETIKRITVDKEPEEVIGPPIKLRGRALRRIGEKELF